MSQPIQRLRIIESENLGSVILTNGEIIIESLDIDEIETANKLEALIEKIEDTSVTGQHILIGKLIVIFKNDGIPFNYGYTITLEDFNAFSKSDVKKAKMILLIVQYLFDTMDMFIRQFSPTNTEGEPFTLPQFFYSESHFEQRFPSA